MNTYEIIVKGQLDGRWAHRFAGLRVVPRPDGTSQLLGPVADQAALHGVLARVRDLGLSLVLLRQCEEIPGPGAREHEGAQP